MSKAFEHGTFAGLFVAPAAWCDAHGIVRACNPGFEDWSGDVVGQPVQIHGDRGWLLNAEGKPLPLRLVPLADGGWLALPEAEETRRADATIATAVARQLERVETSLASTARSGLLEARSAPVKDCLRDVLAAAQEVGALRRQIAVLGAAPSPTDRAPVCLRALCAEAAAALGLPLRVEASEADYTVELDKAHFLPVLVALLAAGTADRPAKEPIVARFRAGEVVRVAFSGLDVGTDDAPVLATARIALAAVGGRALHVPGVSVTLEIPAYAQGLGLSGAGGTVLVADDDAATLAMMGAVLRRAGFRVLAAEDGVVASSLWRLHREEIVAIVADAVLPGRSGFELAAEARTTLPGLAVLVVTGHAMELFGAADLDGVPVLPKPFGARTLAERVRAIIERETPTA